ncbi:MAG: DegT/DnrJ/EryC1/StrS family aminotransferase [Bacteroidota bacterium]
MKIQMVDLITQYERIKPEIDAAIQRVIDSGQFIMGKEVYEFEKALARYLKTRYAIGCASGTDALQIALMALGVDPGDEVITTPFTFVATVETIVLLGAKAVFVDVEEDTLNIDPSKIEQALTKKTKVIIPVHLYGQPAEMDSIMEISRKHGLRIVEDAGQAIGAEYRGRRVGGIGDIGCISFFPSKNLGAFGDAGMMVTNNSELADRLRLISLHGAKMKYSHDVVGLNSRLDTIQAAILNTKLKYVEEWHEVRRRTAAKYDELLKDSGASLPHVRPHNRHIFHQYTIRVKNRDGLSKSLKSKEIPHAIYYPVPLHLQPAYKRFGYREGDFPISERLAKEVLSLPMHTELTIAQLEYIATAVREFVQENVVVS